MKVRELIKELQKYDGELEVRVYKKPVRTKRVVSFEVKNVAKRIKQETGEITAVNIAY